ncbi:hypothetical protein Q73_07270 [Bacillus coahuilensis m2-6]|uniref:CoA-disulfide reductase n=1 Tax=Bacillus coahuilensis TaxID=408580 RepID=UPI0007503A2B|nr:CoA-disulfide reductase [Bacillus coahuilensis]KUP08153.1 hypothetical protein Q73_07270 [Bacillus coahuilensis m2-6]
MTKIIIVGGVAGGASTAARLRRLNEHAEIIMFDRGEYVSFANCGLPYYIGEVIPKRESLLVQTIEGLSKRFNLDIRNLSEVTTIDRENKTITVKNLRTNEEYLESYDKLVLSPGAKPIVPPFNGLNEVDNVFTLRNIPDTDRIKEWVDEKSPKEAVVVGGGFIGLEMAENLIHRGLNVTVVELGKQVMAPLDIEMAAIVHDHLRAKGVNLILEDGVEEFKEKGKKVLLTSGKILPSDITILSIGVKPENELAKLAGLELSERGGILVNQQLLTSDPDIYAIGDAISVKDYVTGLDTMVPLAWPANRQGRLVADHINGKEIAYTGTLGTAIAKVFDLTVAVTGNNVKRLTDSNITHEAVHVHPNSNAGYYPGGSPVALKLTFDKVSGKIFGAQGVGIKGVDKRIDVLATAIKGGLTVQDLPDLELSYAPPFSSAKDPVNMLGYVALNVMEEDLKVVQTTQIDQIVRDGFTLIDVREPMERDMGYIEGSINIPLDQLRDRTKELPSDQPIYVTCQVGLRGYLASRILTQAGFEVYNLSGGYKTYKMFHKDKKDRSKESQHKLEKNQQCRWMKWKKPIQVTISINCSGLQCPGPITEVYKNMNTLQDGEVLEVSVTDPGFMTDIKEWCEKTGNTLLHSETDGVKTTVQIVKGSKKAVSEVTSSKDGTTLVVFNQDLDKAIASYIIATGAAAMGKKTLFHTFWGLNILRKSDINVKDKPFMEKMFSGMMPKGTKHLPISNMNMGGLGSKMIRKVMKEKNVDSIETLMKNAMDMGVEIVACSMSMDVMGIRKEELIDGVTIGGVAAYLGKAEDANVNLFI